MDEITIPDWVFKIVGVVLAVFGFGKAWGVLTARDAAQEKKITAQDKKIAELESEIKRLKAENDRTAKELQEASNAQFKEVAALFVNESGEPRFITYRAHDKMQEHCQRFWAAELAHIKESGDRIEKMVAVEGLT